MSVDTQHVNPARTGRFTRRLALLVLGMIVIASTWQVALAVRGCEGSGFDEWVCYEPHPSGNCDQAYSINPVTFQRTHRPMLDCDFAGGIEL